MVIGVKIPGERRQEDAAGIDLTGGIQQDPAVEAELKGRDYLPLSPPAPAARPENAAASCCGSGCGSREAMTTRGLWLAFDGRDERKGLPAACIKASKATAQLRPSPHRIHRDGMPRVIHGKGRC
jgi:hypothetical protein